MTGTAQLVTLFLTMLAAMLVALAISLGARSKRRGCGGCEGCGQ